VVVTNKTHFTNELQTFDEKKEDIVESYTRMAKKIPGEQFRGGTINTLTLFVWFRCDGPHGEGARSTVHARRDKSYDEGCVAQTT